MRTRLEKLRAMAEHPTSNVHEAEIARREIERLGFVPPRPVTTSTPWTARVWISGSWLFVFAERYELAREVVFEVSDALRYHGFTVTVEVPRPLTPPGTR
jgi:hypothetical protein